MTFIRLHFTSHEEVWINAKCIEAVIARVDSTGDPVGSTVRSITGTRYTVAQTPEEVFELLNRLLNWGEVRDD